MNTTENPVVPETELPQVFTPEVAAPEASQPEVPAAELIYRGIEFDSPEAVALAKEEEARLEDVMRNLDRNSLESIDAAIAHVSTSPSPIKKMYLDTLQSFRMDLLEKGCSFRGVMYESPAHAEHAKQVYAWAQSIYNSIDRTDPAAVKAARDHLSTANHKAAEEFILQLDKILTDLDLQKRTVDGIVFDTEEQADTARQELSAIQDIVAATNPNDEASLLDSRDQIRTCTTAVRDKYLALLEQKLTEYDIKMRTFRGKVYETREEAALLNEEANKIRDILTGMNQSNEGSLLEAKAALEALTTELKNDPLATVEKLLTEYDIRLRTFNGVLYETREEAIHTAEEYQTALAIRQKVEPDKEQSILDAKAAMEKLTTSVKDAYLAELNAMWEAYDRRLRTFGNIVFDTRDEALFARSTYQEFMTRFNTMDLSQSANLVLLEQYVTDTLQEKLRSYASGLIDNVRMVQTRIAYIQRTDAAINPATQKQESADLYKFIDETIPMMTKYRFRTEEMEELKKKHYASLNVGKKFLSFFKK